MIDGRGGLAIANLIFYLIALIFAVILCLKHGFGRSSGWIFLIIVSLIRIAGAIAELVAETQPSIGAVIAAASLANSGFSTLLMAQLGMLQRLHEGIPKQQRMIPPRAFRLMILIALAALAISITSGTYQYSSDPSSVQEGVTLAHVAGILFAVLYAIITLTSAFTFTQIGRIIPGDRVMLYAMALSFPFFLIRLVYIELVDFKVDPVRFNIINGDVVAQGFMTAFPEFVIMMLFLYAGWKAPKLDRSQLRQGGQKGAGATELNAYPSGAPKTTGAYGGPDSQA